MGKIKFTATDNGGVYRKLNLFEVFFERELREKILQYISMQWRIESWMMN